MSYLLDADVFIQAKNLHYGFDFCPAFWDWVVSQNAAGRVFSVEKVGHELQAGGDRLADWAADRGPGFFLPPGDGVGPSLSTVATWITGTYRRDAVFAFLMDADYYLISQAHALGRCVVTHEVPCSSINKIKIPNPCLTLGIECISPFEMLRREGARFVLAP